VGKKKHISLIAMSKLNRRPLLPHFVGRISGPRLQWIARGNTVEGSDTAPAHLAVTCS
jgi:hypothetical protein